MEFYIYFLWEKIPRAIRMIALAACKTLGSSTHSRLLTPYQV